MIAISLGPQTRRIITNEVLVPLRSNECPQWVGTGLWRKAENQTIVARMNVAVSARGRCLPSGAKRSSADVSGNVRLPPLTDTCVGLFSGREIAGLSVS